MTSAVLEIPALVTEHQPITGLHALLHLQIQLIRTRMGQRDRCD